MLRLISGRSLLAAAGGHNKQQLACLGALVQRQWLLQQSRALTNTSSGSYAPSRLQSGGAHSAQRVHGASELASVFDDTGSEHLPSLPVPNLSDTLERLRDTIWPVAMNSAEFAHALELIEQFAQSAGPKLDLLLRNKANQTKNWLSHDWWIQEAYLKARDSLIVHSSPAMIYPQLPFEVTNQRQLISTVARLVSALIDFKFAIRSGYNPEATSAANEYQLDSSLCYAQYRNIFGYTRIPQPNCDRLRYQPASSADEPLKFALSFRGQFYEISLSAQASQSEQTRCDTLISLLNKLFDQQQNTANIADDNSSPAQTLSPGVLTAWSRDQWASTRALLNAEALNALEGAEFLVCLDSLSAGPQSEPFVQQLLSSRPGSANHSEALSRQILHADRANVGNRWFDKSLQLIVVSDENNQTLHGAGINYEHCLAEGQVVARLIEYSYDKAVANQNRQGSVGSQTAVSSPALSQSKITKLDLVPPNADQLEAKIKQAQRDQAALLDQFDMAWFEHKQYGSNAIKSWGYSPDSWFQVSLQLAHYRLHKRLVPCYESASTRRFAFGRTETIRSLTKDVAEFCQEPKFDTMQAAIRSHKSYANAANNANAIDRVLSGYRLVFNELRAGTWLWGVPTFNAPQTDSRKVGQKSSIDQVKLDDLFSEQELETLGAFFNNELIERSKKFVLSTSQVSSVHPNICMSYWPHLPNGYGCCYNLTGQQISAAITANSQNISFSCNVDKLSESLHDSLTKMSAILEEQKKRK